MLKFLRPSPKNSSDLYNAPSTPILPIKYKIKSLPVTNFFLLPVTLTRIAPGTLNQVYPTDMAAPKSVDPTPVENAFKAP